MGIILLRNIRIFSYHGCLVEESKIGSDYSVDLEVKTDLKQAAYTDELKNTVDYVHLNKIVVEEMAIRSKLLEHIAQRIIDRILSEIPVITKVIISVSKLNPPVGGDVESVTVRLKKHRNQK